MSRKMRVLVTGGSGQLGRSFAETYADQYDLTLTYNTRSVDVPGCEAIQLDITDLKATVRACKGMDAIVHLAADPHAHAKWESILPNNIVGTYNAYEAAHRAGIKRFIYASSNHAVAFHLKEHGMSGPDAPVQPDSYYGVSKAFGEAMGSYYHDVNGMQVICLRIGSCQGGLDEDVQRKRHLHALERGPSFPYTRAQYSAIWLSSRDWAQLVHKSLETDCQFGIFYGVSDNEPPAFDLSETKRVLGYAPQDNVADFMGRPVSDFA